MNLLFAYNLYTFHFFKALNLGFQSIWTIRLNEIQAEEFSNQIVDPSLPKKSETVDCDFKNTLKKQREKSFFVAARVHR